VKWWSIADFFLNWCFGHKWKTYKRKSLTHINVHKVMIIHCSKHGAMHRSFGTSPIVVCSLLFVTNIYKFQDMLSSDDHNPMTYYNVMVLRLDPKQLWQLCMVWDNYGNNKGHHISFMWNKTQLVNIYYWIIICWIISKLNKNKTMMNLHTCS
jgi:hypothetical protein